MIRSTTMIFVLLFAVATSYAQYPSPLAAQADSAYQKGHFAESATLYAKAIAAGVVRTDVFYNATCSFALAGFKDSAFYYLGKAVQSGWSNVNHMQKDEDLAILRADSRWKTYVEKAEETRVKNAPIDSLINHLNNLSAVSYQYRVRPKSMGGGEGSYIGFIIPEKMRSTTYGTFSVTIVKADTITFVATSTIKKGTVTAMLDGNGRLSGWIYTGEFK